MAVTAIEVDHTVPAVGFRITSGNRTIMYTGDTGPTGRIWRWADDLAALIVEVSFPNTHGDLSIRCGHLTPALLARELQKLGEQPTRILVTHLKHPFSEQIQQELAELGIAQLEIAQEGTVYSL